MASFEFFKTTILPPVQEADTDDKAKKKLGRLGGRNSHSQKAKVSNKNMFWIWTKAGGLNEDASVFLHECIFSFISMWLSLTLIL